MATPTIEEITTGGIGSSNTEVTVAGHAAVDAGDVYVLNITMDGLGETFTPHIDWTELAEQAVGDNIGWVGYLRLDGTEDGASWVFTLSSNETSVWALIRMSGSHATSDPEVDTYANGTSTAANPTSVTATWGSDTNLFIATATLNLLAFSGGPSGYINFTELDSSTLGASGPCAVAIATKAATAAADDAGAFTNGNDDWHAITVVVRPAAAGGGGTVPVFFHNQALHWRTR